MSTAFNFCSPVLCRVASMKTLITAVAEFPILSVLLVRCFVHEDVINRGRGDELLRQCFTSMEYEDSKASAAWD